MFFITQHFLQTGKTSYLFEDYLLQLHCSCSVGIYATDVCGGARLVWGAMINLFVFG